MKKIAIVAIAGLLVLSGLYAGRNANELEYKSPQWDSNKKRFISNTKSTLITWLQMRFKEGRFPSVSKEDISSVLSQIDLQLIYSSAEVPRATWIGHATVLVQYKGINYLTDPHLTKRPAPIDFLVSERLTPPALAYVQLPKIDFVVISHNHYDHLDQLTVEMFDDTVVWYVPLGLKPWFERRGIASDKIIELDWWQSHQFNSDVEVTLTPSVHWSKRSLWDANKSLWGAWSVKIDDFKSWFGGDTGYDDKLFKEIGRRMGPFQLAFIPIGAYAPRYFMSKHHVDPAQALQIHQDIQSEKSMPIHWGTFQLTQEPFLEPQMLLEKEKELARLPDTQFTTIKIGETILAE